MLTPERRRPGAHRPGRVETEHAAPPGRAAELILAWQASAGNSAVARVLARAPETATKDKEAPAGADDEPPVTKTGWDGAQEWGDRAYRYGQAGQWEKSRNAWAKAYELKPVPTFLYNEAACLERLGRIPEAIAMYKAYLADNPAETDLDKTREHVKRLEGGASAPPDKVGESGGGSPSTGGGADPDEAPITRTGWDGAQDWGDRAYRFYERGEWEKARNAFAEAYKLKAVPTFLYNEGSCLERLGRFGEAIAMYEAYLADNPAETDLDKTREHVRKLKEAHGGGPAPGGEPGEPAKVGEGGGGAPATAPPAGQQAPDEPITETGKGGATKWFDRASAAYLAKDYKKAYDDFMHAYDLFPQPKILYNAAAALELGGDLDGAIAMYDRYLAEKPDAADADKVRAHIAKVKQKPIPEATPGPEEQGGDPPITETGAEGAQKWFDRATAAYLAKDYKKAYDAFMHAYHLLPRAQIVYNAAAALDMAGEADAAIAMYDRYLAEAAGAPDAAKVQKRIEKLKEKAEGAKVDDTPGGQPGPGAGAEPPITATGKEGSQQWFDRGQEQFLAGRYEDAVESFGKAFELNPLPQFVFNQGAALEKQGRPAAAAAAFERYLALDPGAKDYGEVVERVKKLRAAASADPIADPWADEAAGAEPTEKGAKGAAQWFDKARAAYDVGDFKAAHAGFMHAYELMPRAQFLYNAGAALQRDGDAEGAIALYERYLAESPGASDTAKVRKAIDKLRQKAAGGDEPGKGAGGGGDADAEPPITETGAAGAKQWYARGEKEYQAGKFEEAVHSFGTAFELDPSPAYVYDQGVALDRQGRPAAAAAAFERFLALKPDAKNHDEVVERVKKLRGQAAADPIVNPWADEAAGPDPAGEGEVGSKQWYEKAAVAYQVGDYATAHDGFLRAYDLWQRPAYLFDGGLALEKAGDAAGAIALYERSLSEAGGLKDTARVHDRIEHLRAKPPAGAGPEPEP